MSTINLHLGDCLDAMRGMRDKQYDLAIVDPPYAHNSGNAFASRLKRYGSLDFNDFRPTPEYFDELRRVSANQIIWGGNYFLSDLGDTKCMIVWDKKQPVPTYARVELAWTSFQDKHADYIDLPYFGSHGADTVRIHPNQKPVALYKQLLKRHAKPGWKILDTHLGSGSIAIACHDMGFDLDAWERDPVYMDKAYCRYQDHARQMQLFAP